MAFQVSKTTADDASELLTILEEARAFKESAGDNLWAGEPFTTKEVKNIIAAGNTYVAKVDGKPAGSVVLIWDDERTWGAAGNDGQAGYIHRLVTRDSFRGLGIGEKMVEWACEQIRIAGRPYARLDCSYENRSLCEYYEKQGFKKVGRKNIDRYSAALYQKNLVK